jgi:hypothetical protein
VAGDAHASVETLFDCCCATTVVPHGETGPTRETAGGPSCVDRLCSSCVDLLLDVESVVGNEQRLDAPPASCPADAAIRRSCRLRLGERAALSEPIDPPWRAQQASTVILV